MSTKEWNVTRKLIRPTLSEIKEQMERQQAGPPPRRKQVPPEQTHAENFYYVKQMQNKTPMVIVLNDGEVIHGTIEWYDKNCLKITRKSEPNLLIFKPNIKYMYKEGEKQEGER